MKKVLCFLMLMALFVPLAFARTIEHSGFAFKPETKTYTNRDGFTVSGLAIWTPGSGRRIVLLGAMFSSSTKMDFTIEEDITTSGGIVTAATKVIPYVNCTTSGITTVGNGTPIWKGDADDVLYLGVFQGADTIENYSALLWGYEE